VVCRDVPFVEPSAELAEVPAGCAETEVTKDLAQRIRTGDDLAKLFLRIP
jgi:hypothetical protein